jgi:hypothetical protein
MPVENFSITYPTIGIGCPLLSFIVGEAIVAYALFLKTSPELPKLVSGRN